MGRPHDGAVSACGGGGVFSGGNPAISRISATTLKRPLRPVILPTTMRYHLERIPAALGKYGPSLQRCLEAFARVIDVREVVLFGSFARGDNAPSSDVDLCIVADGAERQLETARRLRGAIRDIRPKLAMTLIPITPERLEEKKKRGDHFFRTVLEEGVVLASKD
jgi:predicted nucleotidyltransferase